MYHSDSPSRMCIKVRLMRPPAWCIDSLPLNMIACFYISITRTYMHASQASIPTRVYTHRLHFGPRVVHGPEATHVCIVRAPVPHPHTYIPAPPHTLPSPTSYPSCVMYSASAVSSLKGQAWGIRQALCSLLPHPTPNASRSPDASMLTQAAGHRDHAQHFRSSVCRTMVHRARTPTTRPLPRPAAIASRHATSRAMQVASALLVSQAAPAALFTPHSPCVSLSFMQAHMQSPTLADS
jgi:hypothetical protein